MASYKSILQATLFGLIAVVGANFLIGEPLIRASVSVLFLAPAAWLMIRSHQVAKRKKADQERRLNGALRIATNHFLVSVRNLNRLKVITQSDTDLAEAEELVDEVVREMHQLVDRMRNAAGRSPASLEKETSRG